MIHFFIGTKAQFIKMAPVMVELRNRKVPFRYVDSGQHAELTRMLRQTFGIAEPDVCLRSGSDVSSLLSAVSWSCKLSLMSLAGKKRLRNRIFPGGGICLIHGDTLSTLFGMRMAKAAGLEVGHVEAGLRSFCVWHPFPEELVRIRCMKRCDVLFAPSEEAQKNLEVMKIRGRVIRVDGNTVVDALRLMEDIPATIDIPEQAFALVTCHRLETITRKKRLQQVVSLLNGFAERMEALFVIHTPTLKYLKKFHLEEQISPKVRILGMQDYLNFSALLRSAKLVLTDGGSIQEECAYLGKPCLILRKKTERPDGLGRNAVLWGFEDGAAEEFLSQADSLAVGESAQWPRPSAQIVEALIEMGY
ncbi:MAG: UDP-N-acetylglucosamine 2-epimerase [Planctomycetota bacterium]